MLEYNPFIMRHRGSWSRHRAWWPVQSCVSGDWLWLTRGYRNRFMITGPGEPVVIDNWLTSEEYTWLALKGEINGS